MMHTNLGVDGDPADPERRRQANLLGALSLAVGDRVTRAVEDSLVTGSSGPAALVSLAGYLEGHPIGDLRVPVGLTHSATVRLVDRLTSSGLARRGAASDGRAVAVELTARGRRVARDVADARERALEEALADLGPDDRAQLSRLAARVLASLTPDSAAAGRTCRLCDIDACGHYEGRCPVTEAPRASGA